MKKANKKQLDQLKKAGIIVSEYGEICIQSLKKLNNYFIPVGTKKHSGNVCSQLMGQYETICFSADSEGNIKIGDDFENYEDGVLLDVAYLGESEYEIVENGNIKGLEKSLEKAIETLKYIKSNNPNLDLHIQDSQGMMYNEEGEWMEMA